MKPGGGLGVVPHGLGVVPQGGGVVPHDGVCVVSQPHGKSAPFLGETMALNVLKLSVARAPFCSDCSSTRKRLLETRLSSGKRK